MFWFKKKAAQPDEENLITYAVGKQFPVNRKKHGDGCVFEYLSIGPAILIYYSNPTDSEIKMIKNQEAEIGFFNFECILYVIANIAGNIVECPFNVNLHSESQTIKSMGLKQNLAIFLIDADTNVIKVMRLVRMPQDFANALWDSVSSQFDAAFDKNQYNYLIDAVESRYSVKELSQYIQYSMHCE